MSIKDKLKLSIGSKIVNLPSHGALGNPASVTVRPLLTKDEKFIAAIDLKDPEPSLTALAREVVLDPEFNIENCVSADIVAILLATHILTYGDTIKTSTLCEVCETQEEYLLDSAELGINTDVEFKREFKFTFPVSKISIDYHVLTYGEIFKISQFYKTGYKLLNKKIDETDLAIKKTAGMIDIVYDQEGNKIDASREDKEELLKDTLTKADTDAWFEDIAKNSYDDKFDFTHECSTCHTVAKHRLLVGYDFFFTKTQLVPSVPLTT